MALLKGRSGTPIIDDDEPSPVIIDTKNGGSPFLIVCDHAGRAIPRRLGTLGLSDKDLARHISWDIGAGEVARLLSVKLDAVCLRQFYSRLVVDCNRPPGHHQSVARMSEETEIPGNAHLSDTDVAARMTEIFEPYHRSIAQELDCRSLSSQPSLIVAVHSFTPVYLSVQRAWEAGVLYERNPLFALHVKDCLVEDGLLVGDNEPYQLSDESDYTVPHHAGKRGLSYVELEIRQDLISDVCGQQEWAERLGRILPIAYKRLTKSERK